MITVIFWTAYALVGLFTAVRNTRAIAWEMRTRSEPDGFEWAIGSVLAIGSGAVWPGWYGARRGIWAIKNLTEFATNRFDASEKFDRLVPKGLQPIETLSERKARKLRETERNVKELRGRKAELI